MGTEPGPDTTKPETRRLLTAAQYFLQTRNFADCCKYAARAAHSDPTNPAPSRIFSTASVLSASKISPTHHDYYAILNLPQFDSDVSRIGSTFQTLSSILDPNTNPCPLSWEAFDLLMKAWSVLSNPAEKAEFDGELRRYMDGRAPAGDGGTFWTMCPYCYFVYEYDRVFEDCCLKCANVNCRRVLHAVAIGGPPPPPDVVEKGQYSCPGFMLIGIGGSNEEGIGERTLWVPFAPAGNVDKRLDLNNSAGIVGLTDEAIESNGKVGEVGMKRKKSVPLNSKKVMGRGVRIDGDEVHFLYGIGEECDSNVDRDEIIAGSDCIFI